MKRTLINWLGILGLISLLSYTAAVVFSPMEYTEYNWMAQAVSDLSANNASSKMLWNRLASLYAPCGIVSIMMVCVGVRNKLNKTIRVGIPERFSVFAATGFNAVLGIYLFKNFMEEDINEK